MIGVDTFSVDDLVENSSIKKPLNQADSLLPSRVVDSEENELVQLIKGCRENNPDSQKKLYKKYYGYVTGVALTYCAERADAEEIVNDSFLKVFEHIRSFDTTRPFKPWLRRIVVNTSIDKARANRRFRKHVELERTPLVSMQDVESDLNAKHIYKMLNQLPELLRFVFNMYEIEGYSHREIAEKLDIAESSSRTYLTRAKAQLRNIYNHLAVQGGKV